ncbi:unnamed protein product [Acanthoscelides obtectus]|uniref:Uncharacterized protein n=1 Tax=Acanthoscelides obtectus TaxID=200917 RepID=A0A9P0PC80_ACAOB|nr:unnamed protein product [Acanthoscelides obtectus]CAK1671703.1 hypothetical protein AOBTE_LOCUS28408 [Acanthoscelides obtectus]
MKEMMCCERLRGFDYEPRLSFGLSTFGRERSRRRYHFSILSSTG